VPRSEGEKFSGSCIVTSRNPLIHIGATTATKSERFDAEGMPPCTSRVLAAASDRLLATVNFREFLFFPRTSVNMDKEEGQKSTQPRPLDTSGSREDLS
jgi:hypothetical protein